MEDLDSKTLQNRGIKTKACEGLETLDNGSLSQSWSNNLSEPERQARQCTDLAVEDSALFAPLLDPPLGLILKMATLLHPVCLGAGSVVLPVHLQVTGGTDNQLGQALATPAIASSPGSLSLPVVLDQANLQFLSSQVLLQSSNLIPEQQHLSVAEQNEGPSQNPTTPLSQPQHSEKKSDMSSQPSENPDIHNSEFKAILQELFPYLRNAGSSNFQGSRSVPSDFYSTAFLPQQSTLPHIYSSSPLVSIVPPATLLVPYPLIVPLPVPVPIPVPILVPVPIPDSKDMSRYSSATYNLKSKSTQTSEDVDVPTGTHSRNSNSHFLHLPTKASDSVSQHDVLDLSIKVTSNQTKQDVQSSLLQDCALDLSVANKSCLKSNNGSKLKHGNNSTSRKLTEQVIQRKTPQRHERHHLNTHADIDFDMHYKRTMEDSYAMKNPAYLGQNTKIMRPLQTPMVTLSVKKAVPSVFCEKLVKQPQKDILKNRVVKLKRMTSQNMNIHPNKKQHLTFLPGK